MAKEEFTFQGVGRLARIDAFTSKAGKQILTLVFEQGGQWPQSIPIKCFGRLAEMAGDWAPGDLLEVTGRLGGRDWNGKCFGDCIAQTVEVVADGAVQHREERAGNGRGVWEAPDQDPNNGDETAGSGGPGSDEIPF
jgi:single-stranded DNA-binding protein